MVAVNYRKGHSSEPGRESLHWAKSRRWLGSSVLSKDSQEAELSSLTSAPAVFCRWAALESLQERTQIRYGAAEGWRAGFIWKLCSKHSNEQGHIGVTLGCGEDIPSIGVTPAPSQDSALTREPLASLKS
jgi:hypothetical protein